MLPPGAAAGGLDPVEVAGLDLMLQRAAALPEFSARLRWRLQALVQRRVPARGLERAPVPEAARLRFADGTTVLAKSVVPGQMGELALAMKRGSVTPSACLPTAGGEARLTLVWRGGRQGFAVRVVGLDQPD